MTNEIIQFKIELLEDQLENIERSGFFTEKEIDKYSVFFRNELALLKAASGINLFTNKIRKTAQEMEQEIETVHRALIEKKTA